MSNVIMTIRVMPSGLEVDLVNLEVEVKKVLSGVIDGEPGIKLQPIAFGLKAMDITFVASEDNGSKVEDLLSSIDGVQNVSVQSVSLV